MMPTERVLSQEEAALFFTSHTGPYTDGDQDGEIDREDEPVEALHVVCVHVIGVFL